MLCDTAIWDEPGIFGISDMQHVVVWMDIGGISDFLFAK